MTEYESLGLWTLLPVDASLPRFKVAPKRFASRHLWSLLRESPGVGEERESLHLGWEVSVFPGTAQLSCL